MGFRVQGFSGLGLSFLACGLWIGSGRSLALGLTLAGDFGVGD